VQRQKSHLHMQFVAIVISNHLRNLPSFSQGPTLIYLVQLKKLAKKQQFSMTVSVDCHCLKHQKNRTFEEFQTESNKYHWPSFRKDEIIGDNVKILKTGELVSKCGTHLGSNQPDELGDRFCTDLVCLSGHPKSIETTIAPKATNDKAIATFFWG